MNKIQKIILTAFLFSLSFVPFLWLSKGQLILGYDAVFPLNPVKFLLDRIYSWTSVQGFSMDQSGIQGSLIIHFIDSIPYFFGFSAEYAQKIVFSFWFFAILFSSYISISRIEKAGFIKSEYFKFFFPVLYTFNFYLLQGWWAIERTKFSLVVAAPLILSIILPMVREKMTVKMVFVRAILCSLILTIFNGGGWVGMPLYGGLIVILGCYYLFFGFIFILSKRVREFLLMNLFFIFFGLWHVLLNAYTLLPFALTTIRSYGDLVAGAGGVDSQIEWSRYISSDASFLNLFRLQGIPDWYNNGRSHPYSWPYLNNTLLIFSSFLIPFFLFISFVKKNLEIKIISAFFLFVLIVSQFLTAGAHPPLGFIFEFLMKTIPGFVAFRSAIFKFGYAYWFSVSFFVGLSLSALLVFLIRKIKNSKISVFSKIISPIIVISLIVLYHSPFLTGNIFRIDPTTISARVEMPSYISDFVKWWDENGKTDKILLLPKLNNDWLFEQYKWNYMSLYPITGNFASQGIIENAAILTGPESIAVNELYSSISSGNYKKTDSLISDLGIRYFLVRRDFYYDYPNQKTSEPAFVEDRLSKNPKIKPVITFGEWTVYKHQDPKPVIITKNSSILVSGGVSFDRVHDLIGDKVFVESQGELTDSFKTHAGILTSPSCLTCSAERAERQIIFPKPKILIDSKLYQLIELRDRLRIGKNEPFGRKIDRLTGNTLILIGQLEQLLERDKDPYYIDIAKDKYIKVIGEISGIIPEVLNHAGNPYYYFVSIRQYLDQEEKLLASYISSKADEKVILKILGEALSSIEGLKDKIASYYDSEKGYNRERIYNFSIENPGEYSMKLDRQTIGSIEDSDLQSSLLFSVDRESSGSGAISDSYIDFGNIYFDKGSHSINVALPIQRSIASVLKYEKIVGKNCFSSYIGNFSPKKFYVLRFNSRNNFDPSFFYFIDHGVSFSPLLLNRILIAGEQVDENKIVISPRTMQLNDRATQLRIAFCASSLTEGLFSKNILNFSVVELTSPALYLYQQIDRGSLPSPKVSFKQIDQTRFKVFVEKAESPYYLILNQRNDLGWKANLGGRVSGNGLQNIWYIDKVGNYEVDLFYRPQEYFNVGIIVSAIMLAVTLFIVIRKNKIND